MTDTTTKRDHIKAINKELVRLGVQAEHGPEHGDCYAADAPMGDGIIIGDDIAGFRVLKRHPSQLIQSLRDLDDAPDLGYVWSFGIQDYVAEENLWNMIIGPSRNARDFIEEFCDSESEADVAVEIADAVAEAVEAGCLVSARTQKRIVELLLEEVMCQLDDQE